MKKDELDDFIKNMGKNMKLFRASKGWTQMKLEAVSDVHFTYISQIELGKRRDVSVRVMKRISDAFGITLDELTFQEINVI